MKKLLLAGLLIAFAGIGFTETPKIINPPRPTKNFKWLIVIKHDLEHDFSLPGTHIHFIYTNNYSVKEFVYEDEDEDDKRNNMRWHVETGEGKSEEIIFDGSEFQHMFWVNTTKFMLFTHWDGLPNRPVFLESFCVAKAPRPKPKSKILAQNQIKPNLLGAKFEISSQTPTPQKAKVVFR